MRLNKSMQSMFMLVNVRQLYLLTLVVCWPVENPSMVLAEAVTILVACMAEVVSTVAAVPNCRTAFVLVFVAVMTSIVFARCLCWEMQLADSCC